ncbi:sulfite exporter TauE/SafE family protein [Sphingomonas sp. AAP5]|uniref:sulfite exporter TauE/SafE family protein n=1 Tax=Sphingomonas sp. AAP5 TaxID=1523415 RepID=UPI001057236F|nr:sulfite exporter TauE/SafE family protein [Sphingomonas sp. AAP5]QBM77300.1 sulfite exporter TauE/SafE family protein [Sphingomonas sp. AAP5]
MSAVLAWAPAILAMLAAGLFAGFAAGLFGIGGGFVVVPAMIALLPLLGGAKGEYTHVAIGTSFATIVVTALRSTLSHHKRGAVDFEILKTWAPWIVLGVGVGVLLAQRMTGQTLTFIFAGGIVLMSINFLVPKLARRQVSDTMPSGLPRAAIAGGLGLFSSLLGIGGGTVAVIVMTLCGRSIHKAIATASGFGFIIAVPGTIGWVLIGLGKPGLPVGSLGYVNLLGAVVITSMSILTAPLGVAAAHALPAEPLKRVFGVYLLFIAGVMANRALQM